MPSSWEHNCLTSPRGQGWGPGEIKCHGDEDSMRTPDSPSSVLEDEDTRTRIPSLDPSNQSWLYSKNLTFDLVQRLLVCCNLVYRVTTTLFWSFASTPSEVLLHTIASIWTAVILKSIDQDWFVGVIVLNSPFFTRLHLPASYKTPARSQSWRGSQAFQIALIIPTSQSLSLSQSWLGTHVCLPTNNI